MNNSAKIQLKIRDFFQKYKKIIFIVIIAWAIIFTINIFMGRQNTVDNGPSTTYTPHTTVMDTSDQVPEQLQNPIEDLIDKYFNYCNNGEYENAYNMLSQECKEAQYTTLSEFESYVKNIFGQGGKIYNIQSYSNLDKTYIYNIRILDNILASGTTQGYGYYEEKITIKGDKQENLELNIGDFIDKENLTIFGEDDYLKIEILKKVINYETETYTVKFTNKTEYPIVLASNNEELEIGILVDDQVRKANLMIANITIEAYQTQTRELEFTKFADDEKESEAMIFNAIRVLPTYSGNRDLYEQELNNAIKLYSLSIDL